MKSLLKKDKKMASITPHNQPSNQLSFKDLIVWHKSIDFANKIIDIAEKLAATKRHFRIIEQLEAAATSVPMNIAEGKGRYSKKEYSHFLIIARGSLYETMTLLEIFKMREWISIDDFETLTQQSIEIAKMINGINRNLKQ